MTPVIVQTVARSAGTVCCAKENVVANVGIKTAILTPTSVLRVALTITMVKHASNPATQAVTYRYVMTLDIAPLDVFKNVSEICAIYPAILLVRIIIATGKAEIVLNAASRIPVSFVELWVSGLLSFICIEPFTSKQFVIK